MSNISISRLFALLELFEKERRPLTAAELQQYTDCPRSSLNLLLRGLVDLGYFTYHSKTAGYFPSIRLDRLGSWILPTVLQDSAVGKLLDDLRRATQETVILSMRSDLDMEVVRVATGHQAISLNIQRGYRFPIWHTAVGQAALSTLNPTELARLHRRGSPPDTLSLNEARRTAAQVRERGYAVGYGAVLDRVGAIAAPLPMTFSGRELVLSVGGPEERVRQREAQLADTLCGCIRAFCEAVDPD
jgi:DNA-binding IclR family transcriptional regulator